MVDWDKKRIFAPQEENNRIQETPRGRQRRGPEELKSIYRNFMKEWHPDKFQDTTG